MIKNLKYQLFTGWHLTRWIRLVMGLALLIQAIVASDMLAGAFAFILLFQAVTNTGCCGPAGCSIPQHKENTKGISEPTSKE